MGVAQALKKEPSRVRSPEEGLEDLVRRTATEDASALAALYDATCSRVHGLALRIVRDAGAAEEVTLDVYLQAWRDAPRFDATRGNALAWLLTIARSRAIDRLRSMGRARSTTVPLDAAAFVAASGPGPDEDAAQSQRRERIQRAMARLSPEQREAITIAYFSGMSHSEIAAALGQPLGTIKTRIRLGMIRLREILGASDEER